MLVVERRDQLVRFRIGHLNGALAAQVRRIVVVDDRESTDDLMRDVIKVLTSMRARLRAARCTESGGACGHRYRATVGSGRGHGIGISGKI